MKLKICFQDMPAEWNKWKTTISGLEDKTDIKEKQKNSKTKDTSFVKGICRVPGLHQKIKRESQASEMEKR
jgi:hypothetical protein